MAFLRVDSSPIKKQRLYLMVIEMPSGIQVIKIGKASGESSKERMMQINSSIFDKFRCTAKISIKRDREVDADKVFEYETTLHKFFVNYRYETNHKFDGVTECFVLPENSDDAVQAFEAVIEGLVPDFTYTAPTDTPDKLPF